MSAIVKSPTFACVRKISKNEVTIAAPEERAQRRCRELLERGQRADFDQVLREVTERDRRDTEREASPLRRGEDAVLADTTGLDLEGSFQLLLGLVRERLGSKEERA